MKIFLDSITTTVVMTITFEIPLFFCKLLEYGISRVLIRTQQSPSSILFISELVHCSPQSMNQSELANEIKNKNLELKISLRWPRTDGAPGILQKQIQCPLEEMHPPAKSQVISMNKV